MGIKTVELNSAKQSKWVDLTKPSRADLEQLASDYDLQESIVNDCLDPSQLPKYEKQAGYTFIILRLFNANPKQHMHSMQELTNKVAIFYSDHFLITVHKFPQPFIEDIVASEQQGDDKCHVQDIVARIMLHVFHTYEHPALYLDEQVDDYESTIFLKNAKPAMLHGFYYIRRKAIVGKKMLLLSSEILSFLSTANVDSELMQDIKDLYTKLTTIYDEVLDDVNSLMSIYLSLTSQKTNDVMRILTVVSVVFMPLTFIVGVYGMNFDFMPELRWKWGYPLVMLIMLGILVTAFIYFRRRRWI